MKLYGGFPMPPRGLVSRMHVLLSVWTLPQMTYHLCLLVLFSLTVSSQLGLEDVFFSPLNQTVKEGEGVFLQCVSGESSPPASITWLKDGNMVTRGRQIQGEYGGGSQRKTSGTLHLSNVTLQDDGMYICVTFNPSLNISKWSKPAKLNVQGVPRRLQIIKGPDNITVAMGTEIYMHCAVHGFPVPMVHWFKDDCLLMNCSTSFSLQNNGQLLTFRNVTKEDEGLYHCEASNQEETIRSNSAFLLPAEMDWSFVQQPTNQTVRRGQNVTVTCRPPYSRPPAQVSWFRNNQLLTPTARVIVLPSGDLFLHHVQESDSGRYFCRASNVHLQRFLTSRRATLTVQAPPSVKLLPQVLTVPLGARVLLHCQVSGHPLPSISWVKRGQSKQTGGKVTVGLRNATLHIQSARSYDEGVYACEASNTLGHSRGTAMLTVAVSPIIVTFANQVNVKLGASAVLPCKAVGILPIMYSWSRGRTQSHSLSATIDNDGGTLSISYVQWTDAGEYYCTAENRAGRHQRRTVLTVTAEDHPGDRGKQTRLVLSANTNPSREAPISPPSGAVVEQHAKQKHPLHVQAQHRDPMCFTAHCDATTGTFSPFSSGTAAESTNPMDALAPNQLDPPTTSPSQPLVTQMQPPMLLPPAHPNFQSVVLLVTSDPLSFSNSEPTTESHIQSPLPQFRVRKISSTKSAFPGMGISDQITKPFLKASQFPSRLPTSGSSVTDNKGSYLPNQAIPNLTTMSTLSWTAPLQLTTQNSETNVGQTGPTPQHLPLPPTKQIAQSYPQQSFTQRFLPKFHLELHLPSVPSSTIANSEYRTYSQPSATVQTPTSTTSPRTQLLSTSRPWFSSQRPTPQTQSFTHQKTHLPKFHSPVTDFPDQVSVPSPPNATKGHPPHSTKSTNDSELTELKKNTSQSPMTSNDPRVTQQSPSWLPILEKHDIPIVVGVGVSLAFIFITVTFYSVVQKNEPAPTSRAAQRNLGVPMRHAERRAAGRTYENRAFEDDECVAVIEQSPNISDTRARPPGPSLVTVRLEPTSENLQEEMQPTLDQHSVTVETYPEPILDTKIDPSLDEDKGRSLSQPSIQLHCTEDWPSNGGDNHSPCHDALPPPSSLPSCSPSPSPPSRRAEGLRSSVTLQSTEPFVAPIHHSLNISHGNPPLLLSHHVSLGPTTVAVDVHFYPTATTSMAVGTTTHINSVSTSTSAAAPLFGPPFTNSQVNDQSAPTLHQCK